MQGDDEVEEQPRISLCMALTISVTAHKTSRGYFPLLLGAAVYYRCYSIRGAQGGRPHGEFRRPDPLVH
jgi:hypothetical protein